MLTSKICNACDFDAEWFLPWRQWMKLYGGHGIAFGGSFLHRKEWEWVALSQALYERGMLEKGRSGIGFGVGHEPLPSLFAKQGCRILATDNYHDQNGQWQQWPEDREALLYPEICTAEVFHRNVQFQHVDMNQIPDDLAGYDFSWSCSSLEHLGSLELGFKFLLGQMQCLKPGGWAVHTTEFNLFSDRDTPARGNTVLYRERDIAQLGLELGRCGHHLEPVQFSRGDRIEDWFIAHPPFEDAAKNLAHLRRLVRRHVCTSLLLIMRKAA